VRAKEPIKKEEGSREALGKRQIKQQLKDIIEEEDNIG